MSVSTLAVANNGTSQQQISPVSERTPYNERTPSMGRALFDPKTPEETWRLSEMLAQSNFIPDGYRNQPANIMVAMALGSEVGLAPLQSLQSICVINGHPAVYGDALLALVMSSPLCVSYEDGWDEESQCAFARTQRFGREPCEQLFSLDMAKRAGLLAKKGPWQQYPERMCKMRARSWLCRDVYPDVLRGLSTVRVIDETQGEQARQYQPQQRTQPQQNHRNQRQRSQAKEQPLPAVEVVDDEKQPQEPEPKPEPVEPTEEQTLAVNMIIDALGEAETAEELKAIQDDIKTLPEQIAIDADLINLWNTRRQQLKQSQS